MNLLDFKYWISLNESQKSYYTFEIPKRVLTEIDDEYMKGLSDVLSDLPESLYSISQNQGEIVLTLHPSRDELQSAIYGDLQEVKINLSSPGKSPDIGGLFKKITTDSLVNILKKSNYIIKVIDQPDSIQVRFSIQQSDLDRIIHTAAQRAAFSYSEYNREFIKPETSAFFDLLYDTTSEKIEKFTDILNAYLRYISASSALKGYLSLGNTPNLEEIGAKVNTRLQKIKSIDFSTLSNDEKSEQLKEVLSFQKEILNNADKTSIESSIMVDAMIENFRILLDTVGSPKEIKQALNQVT
jgi:hypothetical protein